MHESNRIEFKSQLNDKLEREVIAFLNYREGGISIRESNPMRFKPSTAPSLGVDTA
ncbi:MAG: hypothetical protein LUG52_06055 [Clostridia bacterium]|nr:hypothetical protein [Clostridia bacterium]